MAGSAAFGPVKFNTDVGFVLDLSDDKQAFTASFAGLAVSINDAGAPPIVTRGFSFVLPLSGVDAGTDIPFAVSGFAGVEAGASAHLIFVVNETATSADFPEHSDGGYVKQFDYKAGAAAELRISVLLVASRDSTTHAAAMVTVSTTDTDLKKPQASPDGGAAASGDTPAKSPSPAIGAGRLGF